MVRITKVTGIKILEVALEITLVILMVYSYAITRAEDHASSAIFGGYCIILGGIWLGLIMETPINRRIDLLFSVAGGIMHFILGVIVLYDHTNRTSSSNEAVAKGSIAVIQGLVFAIDAFLTFKGHT